MLQTSLQLGRKSFSLLILLFVLSHICVSQVSQSANSPVRQTELLTLAATVTNKQGEFVGGLTADNFHVFLDGTPSRISAVKVFDAPANIGIVWDASGSGGDVPWHKPTKPGMVRQAIARFCEVSDRRNLYFFLGFNKSPQLLQDWTTNTDVIVDAVPLTRPRGNSAFFDGLRLAIDKVQQGPHTRRVLILITDGADNRSRYSLSEIREILSETDVLIYSVNLAAEEYLSDPNFEGQAVLEDITALSGGRAFFLKRSLAADSSEVIRRFEIIANELRSQYAIGVEAPASTAVKRWRKLRLATSVPADAPKNMKSLTVRTRAGVY